MTQDITKHIGNLLKNQKKRSSTISFKEFVGFIENSLLDDGDKVYFLKQVHKTGYSNQLKQELKTKLSDIQNQLELEISFAESEPEDN